MQQQISGKVTAIVLAIVVVVCAGVVFYFSKNTAPVTPVVEEQTAETAEVPQVGTEPLVAPDTSTAQVAPTETQTPAMVPEDVQKQINEIARKIDSGELSTEEGQKQVNKLLGI